MKNMLKKAVLIAAVAVSCSASVFAHNVAAYDHAVRGQYFDPSAMVTMCTKVEYLPRYQITNYYYTYGDGTVCLVQVDRAGNVHNIVIN